jgi:hypothetical protein
MRSFDRISRRLTKLAAAILEVAELPTDGAVMYVLRDNEGARFIELATRQDLDGQTALLALDQAVTAAGFEQDSAEGYAGRILTKLHLSRELLNRGDTDNAFALAFELGTLVTEATMKAVFEPDFLMAEKVQAGGRSGHTQRYGTPEQKRAKHARYVAAFE